MKIITWLREAFRGCPCGQYDGGPYGFREHWCTHGCPEHGPGCASSVCVWAGQDAPTSRNVDGS
jgi:hypothetical protein